MTKKERIRGLLRKIHAHMKTDNALYNAGWCGHSGMSYLCYIFGSEGVYPMVCSVPNLDEWERAKLKSLLELFRPTQNELIDLDSKAAEKFSHEFSWGVANEPINFCAPWFGFYGEIEKVPMRELAFWLIVAMLEEEAK